MLCELFINVLNILPLSLSALEGSVEALFSRRAVERRLPQITLLRDFSQPLERYDDYEEDGTGELRAESTLSEKFGKTASENATLLH